jgi:hypothetical protein
MTTKRYRPYLARFAQAVHDERLAAGLTLGGMANLLGVRAKTVWLWENARLGGGKCILRACFEGPFAGSALAQRIPGKFYLSIGEEGKDHVSESIPMSERGDA